MAGAPASLAIEAIASICGVMYYCFISRQDISFVHYSHDVCHRALTAQAFHEVRD